MQQIRIYNQNFEPGFKNGYVTSVLLRILLYSTLTCIFGRYFSSILEITTKGAEMSDNPQGKKYQKSKMGLNLLWLHNWFKKTHIRSPTEFVAEMQFDVYEIRILEANGKGERKVSLCNHQISDSHTSYFQIMLTLEEYVSDLRLLQSGNANVVFLSFNNISLI